MRTEILLTLTLISTGALAGGGRTGVGGGGNGLVADFKNHAEEFVGTFESLKKNPFNSLSIEGFRQILVGGTKLAHLAGDRAKLGFVR